MGIRKLGWVVVAWGRGLFFSPRKDAVVTTHRLSTSVGCPMTHGHLSASSEKWRVYCVLLHPRSHKAVVNTSGGSLAHKYAKWASSELPIMKTVQAA